MTEIVQPRLPGEGRGEGKGSGEGAEEAEAGKEGEGVRMVFTVLIHHI